MTFRSCRGCSVSRSGWSLPAGKSALVPLQEFLQANTSLYRNSPPSFLAFRRSPRGTDLTFLFALLARRAVTRGCSVTGALLLQQPNWVFQLRDDSQRAPTFRRPAAVLGGIAGDSGEGVGLPHPRPYARLARKTVHEGAYKQGTYKGCPYAYALKRCWSRKTGLPCAWMKARRELRRVTCRRHSAGGGWRSIREGELGGKSGVFF